MTTVTLEGFLGRDRQILDTRERTYTATRYNTVAEPEGRNRGRGPVAGVRAAVAGHPRAAGRQARHHGGTGSSPGTSTGPSFWACAWRGRETGSGSRGGSSDSESTTPEGDDASEMPQVDRRELPPRAGQAPVRVAVGRRAPARSGAALRAAASVRLRSASSGALSSLPASCRSAQHAEPRGPSSPAGSALR